MRKLIWILPLLLFWVLTAFTERRITIFMIGDSTMADKSLKNGNQERGWGQMLSDCFTDDILIENHAVNGRSSKSFIDEGRWETVIRKVKPGDYVFIQFGHNDEKEDVKRHTDPGTTFDDNLRRFVKETRAKGGIPVLFNSIVRRNYSLRGNAVAADDVRSAHNGRVDESDTLIDTHGAYLLSPRRVAAELHVPFVDMNAMTRRLVESFGKEGSKQLFMWIAPGVSPACPDGRQDNTHLNVFGARLVSSRAADLIAEAVPALARYVRHFDLVVAKDGSGDFFTVQEAINAVPDFRKNHRTTILVKAGEYDERVIVPPSKLNISLIGEEGTIVTGDGYAAKKNRFGDEMSTSGSSTFYIYAPDFYAENITFRNTAGRVGQAVACFVSGDRAYFKNCRFLGNQDTLYTYGKDSRQFYEHCYIEGTVDFIFGWSTAVFYECTIHSLANGYVSAPSTDKGKAYGYVFWKCRLTGSEEARQVYLARPWRPYGQSVFLHCDLGGHILPSGWNNWDNPANEKTAFFAEYASRGEGAAPRQRAAFGRQLTDDRHYRPEAVLAGEDGWNPLKNGNALLTHLKR